MLTVDYVRDLLIRLHDAGHGERSDLIKRACSNCGVSIGTMYRHLRVQGFDSGRGRRSDFGRSVIDDSHALQVAAMVTERQNGKRAIALKRAIDIARANDLVPHASPSTYAKAMIRLGCHPDQLAVDRPHSRMRSNHPNHVWQLDPSTCVLFYLKNKIGLRAMTEVEFNKNKPQNLEKIVYERVQRYVAVDHTTGSLFARYYLSPGETAITLFDFLLQAMAPKPYMLMHGVPFVVIWDKGSANISAPIKRVLDQLQVNHFPHATANSRAKGAVERAQNIVEMQFEARLRFTEVHTIEQLNAFCEGWLRTFNAVEKHSRHGHARNEMWQLIKPSELRICPDPQLLRILFTQEPVKRKVSGNYEIRHTAPRSEPMFYGVSHLNNVRPGDWLEVAVNPYRLPNLLVIETQADGTKSYTELKPIALDRFGLPVDAPVFGESFAAQPDSDVDTQRKAARMLAAGATTMEETEKYERSGKPLFGGTIDPFADVKQATIPDYMQRPGVPLVVPDIAPREAPKLDCITALKLLSSGLGRALEPHESDRVMANADGMTQAEVTALIDQINAPARPKLTLVRSA